MVAEHLRRLFLRFGPDDGIGREVVAGVGDAVLGDPLGAAERPAVGDDGFLVVLAPLVPRLHALALHRLALLGIRVRLHVLVERGGVARVHRHERLHVFTSWMRAMMLPSLSLNHAAFAPPPVAMPSFIVMPPISSESYSSNFTPRERSCAISLSRSSTFQNAWLALDVPALSPAS